MNELFFNSISSSEILSHFPISSKTVFKSLRLMKLYLTPNFFKEEFLVSMIDFINFSKPLPFILLYPKSNSIKLLFFFKYSPILEAPLTSSLLWNRFK